MQNGIWRRVAAISAAAGLSGGPVLAGDEPATRPAAHDAIVEPEALVALLNAAPETERPLLLDVRDAAAYAEGHVARAVHVDPALWKDESLAADTGLEHDALWRGRIGALGISGRDPVVIYDDGRMTEAARVWFIFQHFGVTRAAVVNGGFKALSGLPADGALRMTRTPTAARPVEFQPVSGATGTVGLAERERVKAAVAGKTAQVFDARTPEEFSGADARKNKRAGHLPEAINLPHTQLLDAGGRLKSPAELAKLFEAAGLRRGQPVITHCDGGGRASLAALAADRAGFGPVMNYYLSFGDWSKDASCPIETPGEKPGE